MRARGVGHSTRGQRRSGNEDRYHVDDDLQLYIVSDGMGGHSAGEVASSKAVEVVIDYMSDRRDLIEGARRGEISPGDVAAVFEAAVEAACKAVYDLAQPDPAWQGMGCTLTAFVALGIHGVMAHVGDSRLYLSRGGATHQLSHDHTMAAELARRGIIPVERVRTHPYSHTLTRSIGPQPAVEVDTLVVEVLGGDRYLLCSDGFSEYVPDPEWLGEQLSAAEPEALVAFADAAGGADNITVVVVNVEVEPSATEFAVGGQDAKVELDALASIFLFRGLPLADLARVLDVASVESVADGEAVVTRGTPLRQFVLVLDGALAGEFELGPREHVGEGALVWPHDAPFELRALGRTRLLRLERDAFRELARTHPLLGVELLERLGRQLAERAFTAV